MLDANFFPLDLYSLLQILFTALIIAAGFLHLLKNAASKFFVDGNLEEELLEGMESSSTLTGVCYVCGISASKQCARCKTIMYCSTYCQSKHWTTEHKVECKPFKSINSPYLSSASNGVNGKRKSSGWMISNGLSNSLMPCRPCKVLEQSNKVIFPYDEFEKLFKWDNLEYAPCGLLNCGNSCYANVVLQCLACTRPLVAYLLEKGHSKECNRNDWCFLCELQSHICRVSHTRQPFSPMSILSRLPNIGGSLGYGRQEDAHEFMRFAIDTMQTVFLDEFGGEKALGPIIQETTLIQHIFGGDLQSQVLCTQCSMVSNRYENMMDLTVEIHGDADSLEDCLIQFTGKEPLDGENMYKCDGCNGYVKAWKRLTIHRPPNILTIALKRFQSGRYGKLNKRVTFPETLDLGPYMSGDATDDINLYSLYAVVVHLDKLNASFCGHYICYIKDFTGNWYWIDDCKVMKVDLEEVLTQRAYMLLYSRNTVRRNTIKPEISVSKVDSEIIVGSVKSPSESDLLSGKIHECLDTQSDSKLLEDHYDEKLNATCKDMREEAEMNNFNATLNLSPTSVKHGTHSNDLEEIVPVKIIIEEPSTNQYCTGINTGNVNFTEDTHHENVSLEISPKDLEQKMGLTSNLEDEFKQKIVDAVDVDEMFPFSPSGFTNEPTMPYNTSSSEYCYESVHNLNSSSSDCLESSVLKPNSGTCFPEQRLQQAEISRISTEKDDVLESGNIKSENNLNVQHGTECLEKIYPFFSADFTGKVPCMDSLITNGKEPCNSIEASNGSSVEESSGKVSDYGENLETFHHECKDDVLPGIEPLVSPLFDRSLMNSSLNNCEISAENEKVGTILFTDAHPPLFERAPLNNSKNHEISSKNEKARKASIAVQVTKEEESHLYNIKCNGLDNHGSSSENCENGRTPKLSNEVSFLKPGFLNSKLPRKSTMEFENTQVKHSGICISGKLEMNGNGYAKDGCSDQSRVEILEPQKILVPSVANECGINIDSTKPLFSSGFLNKPRKKCVTPNGSRKLVHHSCKYETCSKGLDNPDQNGKV